MTASFAALPAESLELPQLAGGIVRLVLTDFRCYDSLSLTCDRRPVVLTGPNGAGKTNILEAISLLSPGRGLRQMKLNEALRHHQGHSSPSWGVSATVESDSDITHVGTAYYRQDNARDRRQVQINEKLVASQAQLAEVSNVIWLTPQMDRLFLDGVSARRRFLDRLVYSFDSGHADQVLKYEHYMRERLRILKQQGSFDPSWVGALEAKMVQYGVAITLSRARVVSILAEETQRPQQSTAGDFPAAQLALHLSGWHGDGDPKSEAALQASLQEALLASRFADRQAGRTLVGPHRDDLQVRYQPKETLAEFCSTGEQKALLLSIILATCRLKAKENSNLVVLLDEVVAHLDAQRRGRLYAMLIELGVQAWLTGTDAHIFDEIGEAAQHFKIVDGRITRYK